MSLIQELTFTRVSEMFAPYAFRECQYKVINDKQSITMREIKKLIHDKELKGYHLNVLDLFAKYKYLTRHQIEQCLGNDYLNAAGETVNIKTAISYLVNKNILLRFYCEQKEPIKSFVDDDVSELGDTIEGAYPHRKRSVYIYTLSKGGLEYLIKETHSINTADGFLVNENTHVFNEPVDIFKKLALNSFLIRVSNSPSKGILAVNYASNKGVYTVEELTTACVENKRYNKKETYHIVSIRKNNAWEKSALEFVNQKVLELGKEGKPLNEHSIVFLCETRWQSYELFKYLISNIGPSIRFYFACDGYVNNYDEYYFSEFYIENGHIYQVEKAEPF